MAVENRSLSLLDVGITGSSEHTNSAESLTPRLHSPAALAAPAAPAALSPAGDDQDKRI